MKIEDSGNITDFFSSLLVNWLKVWKTRTHPAADILGERNVVMETNSVTKEQLIARLWELAAIPPEKTRGNLKGQISACNTAYCTFGFEPALGRLGQLAGIDAARTRGRRRDQESAAKLLKHLLSSLKPDKSGVQ